MSFTREIEENNEFPFLDILILRKNDNFLTKIYRKNSFTVNTWTINLGKTLYHKAYKTCSPCLLETDKIKVILMNNCYPDILINKEIKLHSERLRKKESYGPQKLHVT